MQVRIGRRYARVCRRRLRDHLVSACRKAGVKFVSGDVSDVEAASSDFTTRLTCSSDTVPSVQAR
jgi:hypothetical protein